MATSHGEHSLRLRRIGRLAEDLALEHDLRVDPEHGTAVGVRGDAARLSLRMLAHDLGRVCEVGRRSLLVARLDDVEGNAELLEDGASLRRARRQ